MNTHLRAHVGRRRAAIDRLRTLTTGVVAAGVAGTVGFGLLAAATFRGNPSNRAVAADDSSHEEDSSADEVAPAPARISAPAFEPAPAPRAARNQQGHAATGGSG
ncbi:MAG TPA: hypothetical protein VFY18_09770 [Candidatus Limnocylindrales bacterium]|nr:hypothetical protein [Candidatus Limnocylindrales bacterium]